MFVLPSLLGFSDLGLFLAVIGVYVFFSALWLIYTLTERNFRVGSEIEQRIEKLRSETQAELAQATKMRNNFVQKVAAASKTFASREEISQLRTELATVREIAVLSGKRVRTLQAENNQLKELVQSQSEAYDQHVAEHHVEASIAEETVPALSVFKPEPVVEEEQPAMEEADVASSYDAERGMVYDQRPSSRDDLTRIWGVGAVNQDLLNENGVYFFKQIANWNAANIDKFNAILCFRGRIEREDWVGQANRLVLQQRHAA